MWDLKWAVSDRESVELDKSSSLAHSFRSVAEPAKFASMQTSQVQWAISDKEFGEVGQRLGQKGLGCPEKHGRFLFIGL